MTADDSSMVTGCCAPVGWAPPVRPGGGPVEGAGARSRTSDGAAGGEGRGQERRARRRCRRRAAAPWRGTGLGRRASAQRGRRRGRAAAERGRPHAGGPWAARPCRRAGVPAVGAAAAVPGDGPRPAGVGPGIGGGRVAGDVDPLRLVERVGRAGGPGVRRGGLVVHGGVSSLWAWLGSAVSCRRGRGQGCRIGIYRGPALGEESSTFAPRTGRVRRSAPDRRLRPLSVPRPLRDLARVARQRDDEPRAARRPGSPPRSCRGACRRSTSRSRGRGRTRAARLVRPRPAVEAVEDLRQLGSPRSRSPCRRPRSGPRRRARRGRDLDLAAARRELDGVAHEVRDHLADPRRVVSDPQRPVGQARRSARSPCAPRPPAAARRPTRSCPRRSSGRRSSRTRPESSFESSSRFWASQSSRSSCAADESRNSARAAGSRPAGPWSSSMNVRIAAIGVRSSWLTSARKSRLWSRSRRMIVDALLEPVGHRVELRARGRAARGCPRTARRSATRETGRPRRGGARRR